MTKSVKVDPALLCYFPDISEKRVYPKEYMVNILNSVYPNSMIEMTKTLRTEKIAEHQKETKKFMYICDKYA